MLKKFYDNLPYNLILCYIVTPVIVMFINYYKIPNYFFWYFPNLIASFVGIYVLLTNIKNYKNKEYVLVGVFLIISIISSLLAYNPIKSFFGIDSCNDSLLAFVGYLGFFYCGTKIKDRNKLKVLSKIFIIVAMTIAILTLSKLDIIYKMFVIPKDVYYFYKGPFSFFNQFGAYLLYASIINMFLVFYSKGKSKIFYIISNIILVFTLVLNDTFSVFLSYLGILILVIIYCIKYKKYRKELIVITLIFIISCFTASRDGFNLTKRNFVLLGNDLKIIKDVAIDKNVSNDKVDVIGTNRGELWINGVKYIFEKPLFGYGYENVYYRYLKDNIDCPKPHNRYIEIAQNTGVISLIIYLTLFILIIIKNIKRIKSLQKEKVAALFFVIGFLINAFFSIAFFNTTAYFFIVIGVLAQNYYMDKKYE